MSLLLLFLLPFVFSQPIRPNGNDRDNLLPVQPDTPIFNQRLRSGCVRNFRTFDGVCTSFGTPERKLWASTNRPHFSYFQGRDTLVPRGEALPSARLVSNMLCRQGGNTPEPRGLAEMATFFGQFIDHTIVATTTNKAEPMPIKIPDGDPVAANFSKSEMPFFRSVRVRVRTRDMTQTPSNVLPSAIDLASVYGPNKERCDALRQPFGGLMKTSSDGMLPLNYAGLNNAPRSGPEFFLAGDHRANEHPMLTTLHTVFLREHNHIAWELARKFPKWNSEMLFQVARKINGAQMQKIVYEQWYPAVTGRRLGRYSGFSKNVDPTVSVSFSTAGFRVGHTMVGNRVNRAWKGNQRMASLSLKEMFFKSADKMKKDGLEVFLRGAMINRAQKIDVKVNDALRNFLFTGIGGEEGLHDLVALNIQRGRDHALPTYNALRVKLGFPKAVTFAQITRNKNVRSALQNVYKSAGLVEMWPGLMAEDHAKGSSMGPTMLRLWRREFTRLRDGDSFFYLAAGMFSKRLREEIPRVGALYNGTEDTFRGILLRNTEIIERDLPKKMFFVDGYGA